MKWVWDQAQESAFLKHPKRWAKIQLLKMPEDTEDPSPLAVNATPGQKVEGLEAD